MAVLKRGSHYASFRETITYRQDEGHEGRLQGFVHLKLFNLVMEEVSPTLLRRGVTVSALELREFFSAQQPEFWAVCAEVLVDEVPVACGLIQDGEGLSQGNALN